MIRDDLPCLRPLSSVDPKRPALLVDEAADPDALYIEAECRLSAARDLLFTVSLAAGKRPGSDADPLDGRDVASIAQAAQLLTSDALDLMTACNTAHERRAKRLQASTNRFTDLDQEP